LNESKNDDGISDIAGQEIGDIDIDIGAADKKDSKKDEKILDAL
jgi:hypothetical protein